MFSRTSRILLVLALLLVGAYLLIERPRQRAEEKREVKSERLASFDAASVDSVVLERPRDTLRFTKADSVWRITAPLVDIAEPATITTLFDALNTADINRDLGAETKLAPYGLDHPDVLVTLASKGRVVLQVAVGKHTVDDAWCYARMGTGDVLLVPTDVHHSSTLPLDAYRNRHVLDFQVRDVTAYALQTAVHAMAWTRRGPRWYAVARDAVVGDSVAVESPLHRLRGLRVSTFAEPGDTLPAPADSVRTMALQLGTGRRASLRFTHMDHTWLVRERESGRNMTIAEDISDLFAHTTNELRDRRLLQFDPSVAERITFASPSASGELVRAGGRWSFPNPAMGRVNPEHAADLVRALRGLKWSSPGGEASRTGGHAQYRMEITGARDTIDELSAGPYDAATCWVTSRSSRGTWLVDKKALEQLAARFSHLRDR